MSKLLILTASLLLTTSIYTKQQQTYGSLEVSTVTSIYDRDTFRANINKLHPLIGKRIPIRVANIDTPEIKGKCQKEKNLARQAKQLTVSLLRDAKHIELKNVKRGKYFRIVADVYVDNKNLADILYRNGLGVRYNGKTKKKNWCK